MLTNDLTTILVAVALWVMAGLLGLLHHARRTGKELPDDWAPWMGAAMLGPLTPVLAAYGRMKKERFRQATLADEAFASVQPDTPTLPDACKTCLGFGGGSDAAGVEPFKPGVWFGQGDWVDCPDCDSPKSYREGTIADAVASLMQPAAPQPAAEDVKELRRLSKRELAEMVLRARRQGKQVRLRPATKEELNQAYGKEAQR